MAVRAPAGPAPTTAAVLGLATSPASVAVAVADGRARPRRVENVGRRAVRTCWTTRACSWKTSAMQSQSLRNTMTDDAVRTNRVQVLRHQREFGLQEMRSDQMKYTRDSVSPQTRPETSADRRGTINQSESAARLTPHRRAKGRKRRPQTAGMGTRLAARQPSCGACAVSRSSTCVGNSRPEALTKSPSSTPRQRQIKLRAASSLSQPRPISADWQMCSGWPAIPAVFPT